MPKPRARSNLGANLLTGLGSMLLAGLFVALVEGGLRFSGIGDPDPARASRLAYQHLDLPVLRAAKRADGTPDLRPADPRLPFQSILAEKPAGGLRVFVLGGSAAAGLGYSPNATFARYLERMLRQAEPDRAVEVANLAIVAMAARQVQLLVAEVHQRYDPDLVVVYSGNNEFLELHAEKYARARAGILQRAAAWIRSSALYRLARRAFPADPAAAGPSSAGDDLRLSERTMARAIETSPEETAGVVDRYEAHLDAMAAEAAAGGTPIVLMTVASNWKWRGRSDLPDGWLRELLRGEPASGPEAYRRARAILTGELETAAGKDRSELLFRRAAVAEELGKHRSAAEDYRAAKNLDPYRRRALETMNDRVRGVAARRGAVLLDSVEALVRRAPYGILGFETFYDHVHFTPRGAMILAAALCEEIERRGLAANATGFDPQRFVHEETAWLDGLVEDPLSLESWLGFGFDAGRLADRDLWKYERLLDDLDARLARDPRSASALAYRGNYRYFQLAGAAAAERDYRAALAVAPERTEVRRNLERLLAEGRR